MKTNSKRYIFTILAALGIAAMSGCSMFKPASKEDATKKILTDLFDNCKNGKNEDVAKQLTDIMPQKEMERLKVTKLDYSEAEGKKQVDGFCQGMSKKFGTNYEFGKSEVQGDMVAWEVFPNGGKEGNLFAFKPKDDGKYELVDIDPAKR